MPLDPQARTLLEAAQALGLPPRHTLTPQQAREQTNARPAAPGEPVHSVEDRNIPGPGGEIPVRLYRPDGRDSLPALVFFHGGGWVVGSIATTDANCRALANGAGCLVVSVDYRLAPEYKFPAAADDAFAATEWVYEHAEELGVDGSRLAVGGLSAGANLAAVVTLMARDRGGPDLAFQFLGYPVTDYDFETPSHRENASGYQLTREDMQWFWQHYLPEGNDGRDPYLSPLRAMDLRGLPPGLVITAEYDPLRDEGEAYANRLREAGVTITCTRYDGVMHGFIGMAHLLDKGNAALTETQNALRSAFARLSAVRAGN